MACMASTVVTGNILLCFCVNPQIFKNLRFVKFVKFLKFEMFEMFEMFEIFEIIEIF